MQEITHNEWLAWADRTAENTVCSSNVRNGITYTVVRYATGYELGCFQLLHNDKDTVLFDLLGIYPTIEDAINVMAEALKGKVS